MKGDIRYESLTDASRRTVEALSASSASVPKLSLVARLSLSCSYLSHNLQMCRGLNEVLHALLYDPRLLEYSSGCRRVL